MTPKPGYLLLVVLACLAIASLTVSGQALDEWSRVRGTVVDADGNPMKDVVVNITNTDMGREYKVKTKKKGQFSCNRIMPGNYSYTVSVEGYKSVGGSFSVIPKSRQTLEINLVRETPDEVITRKKAVDLYNEGVKLARAGRADEAIEKLEESLDLDPETADAWYNLGVLLREKERTDEAEMAFLEALDLDPDIELAGNALAEIYFHHGNRLVDDGEFEAAFDVLAEAHSYDSENPLTNYLLGLLCVKKSDDQGAIGYFEAYLRLAPEANHAAEVRSALEKLLNGS